MPAPHLLISIPFQTLEISAQFVKYLGEQAIGLFNGRVVKLADNKRRTESDYFEPVSEAKVPNDGQIGTFCFALLEELGGGGERLRKAVKQVSAIYRKKKNEGGTDKEAEEACADFVKKFPTIDAYNDVWFNQNSKESREFLKVQYEDWIKKDLPAIIIKKRLKAISLYFKKMRETDTEIYDFDACEAKPISGNQKEELSSRLKKCFAEFIEKKTDLTKFEQELDEILREVFGQMEYI